MDKSQTHLGTRDDFPITNTITYLDNAFIGPLPKPIYAEMTAWLHSRMCQETDIYAMFDKLGEVRNQFSKVISAKPENIGLLYTTSEGENIVSRSLDLRPGDNIVSCDLSYPHVFVLGKELEKSKGVEFRVVEHENGCLPLEKFAEKIDHKTRLVMLPWVSNINGLRFDIKKIADLVHAKGGYLYVDAIQIVGTQQLDVIAEDIDFLCCGGYKWIMAGWGVAPFYVRKDLLDKIHPDRFGWRTAIAATSAEWGKRWTASAEKFEYGSPSFDQVYAMSAALKYLDSIGLDRIHAHSKAHIEFLRTHLEDMGFQIFTPPLNDSPTLTFWVNSAEQKVDALFKSAGVRIGFASGSRTSETYGDNVDRCRVRISPAHYNTMADLEQALNVCDSLR